MNEKIRVYFQYRACGAVVDEGPPAGFGLRGCTITVGSFGFAEDDDAVDREVLSLGPMEDISA